MTTIPTIEDDLLRLMVLGEQILKVGTTLDECYAERDRIYVRLADQSVTCARIGEASGRKRASVSRQIAAARVRDGKYWLRG